MSRGPVGRPGGRHDPLAGISRVVVDGSNQRGPSSEPLPEEELARSLRRLFAASIEVIVVFDTDPPHGGSTVRSVGGVTVVHARAGGGDDAIVRRVADAPTVSLVVTDDAELRERVEEQGARAVRNQWLRERHGRGRASAASIGRRVIRPPREGLAGAEPDADDRPRWSPGRGATAKRGPSRRPPRRR
jgi:hypothetical protein